MREGEREGINNVSKIFKFFAQSNRATTCVRSDGNREISHPERERWSSVHFTHSVRCWVQWIGKKLFFQWISECDLIETHKILIFLLSSAVTGLEPPLASAVGKHRKGSHSVSITCQWECNFIIFIKIIDFFTSFILSMFRDFHFQSCQRHIVAELLKVDYQRSIAVDVKSKRLDCHQPIFSNFIHSTRNN